MKIYDLPSEIPAPVVEIVIEPVELVIKIPLFDWI